MDLKKRGSAVSFTDFEMKPFRHKNTTSIINSVSLHTLILPKKLFPHGMRNYE